MLLFVRWFLFLIIIAVFVFIPSGVEGTGVVQANYLSGEPTFAQRMPVVAEGNSEYMLNLIIGAVVIVLVIFVGVTLRRPK